MVPGASTPEMLPVIDKAKYTKTLQESETNRKLRAGKVIAWTALCSCHGGGLVVLILELLLFTQGFGFLILFRDTKQDGQSLGGGVLALRLPQKATTLQGQHHLKICRPEIVNLWLRKVGRDLVYLELSSRSGGENVSLENSKPLA